MSLFFTFFIYPPATGCPDGLGGGLGVGNMRSAHGASIPCSLVVVNRLWEVFCERHWQRNCPGRPPRNGVAGRSGSTGRSLARWPSA